MHPHRTPAKAAMRQSSAARPPCLMQLCMSQQ
jgi:hypothetical protein